MSGKNNIDQLVSDKFTGHQLPVNEAHWASTQSFINAQKRKKRRVVAFWFFGLLLVSSIGYLTIDYLNEPVSGEMVFNENSSLEKKLLETERQPSHLSNHTHNIPSTSKGETSTTQEEYTPNVRTPIYGPGSNRLTVIGIAQDSSAFDSSNASIASTESFQNKGSSKGSSSISLSLSLSSGAGQDSSKQTNPEEDSNPHSSTQSKPTASTSLVVETQFQSTSPKSEINSHFTVLDSSANDSLNQDDQQSAARTFVSTKFSLEDSLSLTDEGLGSEKRVKPGDTIVYHMDDSKDSTSPVDSPQIALPDSTEKTLLAEATDSLPLPKDSFLLDEKRSSKGWFLMPYFGPSLSLKTLSGTDQDLLGKRENDEQNPVTADMGIAVRYGFSNGLYLGTGVNYYKMGENAKYSAFDIVNQKQEPFTFFTYQDNSYFEYANWDTAFLPFEQKVYTAYRWVDKIDSTQMTGEKTVIDTVVVPEKTVNNRFSYLEIPLLVGYQVPLGKWYLGGDVGTGVNFLVKAQGSYPNLETGVYPDIATSEYRLLTYTFLTNLSIGRQLGPHWILYGNLRFRNQLTSAQKSNDLIQARYKSLGIQFRLNYRF